MWVEDSWLSSVRRYSAHWHYDDNVSGAISIVAKFPSLLSAEMVKSSFNERNTMAAPLFLRYRTKDNTPYVFESRTGRIFEADELTYRLLSQYGILNRAEMKKNYGEYGVEEIDRAIDVLDAFRKEGY